MKLTRRAVVSGGLLTMGAWFGLHVFGRRPLGSAPEPLFLTASELRTLEYALEVLAPVPERARALAEGVDRALAEGDPLLGAELALALTVLEYGGELGPLSFARFSRHSEAERGRLLLGWQRSRLGLRRQIFQALRRVAVFAGYADSSLWEEVGYDGPWVGRVVPVPAAPAVIP